MSENRGRPSENNEIMTVRTEEFIDSAGSKSIWKYDSNKFSNGSYSVETIPAKHQTSRRVYDLNQRSYGSAPVVMVFKSSDRVNAKTKIKIFNKNVDYINHAKTLPGVPDTSIILEMGVGEVFIELYKKQYNLN